jgi:hypothetical protein
MIRVDRSFESFGGVGANAVENRLQALEPLYEIVLHTKKCVQERYP